MDYYANMYLTWLRNAENIEFALNHFEAEGYDLSDTLGPRIKAYREAFNLGDIMIDDISRGAMHDAVHVVLGKMDETTATELHVAVGEMVLLRGRYDESHIGLNRNIQNNDLLAALPSYPSDEAISAEVKRRKSDLAQYNDVVEEVSSAELAETKRLCLELDKFIQSAANGRILEQFSSLKSREDIVITTWQLPVCFMGAQGHPSGDILKAEPIPAPERLRLMKIFDDNRPHKHPAWVTDYDARNTWSREDLETAAKSKMVAVRQRLSQTQLAPTPEHPAPENPTAE